MKHETELVNLYAKLIVVIEASLIVHQSDTIKEVELKLDNKQLELQTLIKELEND